MVHLYITHLSRGSGIWLRQVCVRVRMGTEGWRAISTTR